MADARASLFSEWKDEGYGKRRLGDFLDADLQEPERLVEGVIPAGTITILAGQHKVGKTFMLTQMGLSIAGGAPWLGFNTTPTKVLYLNYEVAAWSFQRRIRGTLDGMYSQGYMTDEQVDLARSNIVVESLPDLRLNSKGEVVAMGEWLRDNEVGLVILDPVRGAIRGDRNKDEVIDAIMQNILDHVVKESGAAVLMGHHMRKPPTGESVTGSTWDVKGAGAFSDASDNIITMWRDKKDKKVTHMAFTLRHYEGIDDFEVAFQPSSKFFKPLSSTPTPPPNTGGVTPDDLI